MVYSAFIVHRTVRYAEPANDHYGNATGCYGDPSACSMYQALSPPLEGPGNEARLGAAGSTMVLQQWCAITLSPGVLSLHTQQSVHFRPFSIATPRWWWTLVSCPDPTPNKRERVWCTSSHFLYLLTQQFRILDYQSDYRHVILSCDL